MFSWYKYLIVSLVFCHLGFWSGNLLPLETGSMTGILGQLKWESLKKRRKDSRLILLYKGLKGQARIPTDDLIPNRRCRNQHSLTFQIPSASKEAYKSSFFPQTIRDWNDLPDSLISSAEMSDDCVSKFASLVRASEYFPFWRTPLVKYCQFGVSPVNHSDSESNVRVTSEEVCRDGVVLLRLPAHFQFVPFVCHIL